MKSIKAFYPLMKDFLQPFQQGSNPYHNRGDTFRSALNTCRQCRISFLQPRSQKTPKYEVWTTPVMQRDVLQEADGKIVETLGLQDEQSVLSEILEPAYIDQLSEIHEQYHRMKCLLSGEARPTTSLSMIHPDLVQYVTRCIGTHEIRRQKIIGENGRLIAAAFNSSCFPVALRCVVCTTMRYCVYTMFVCAVVSCFFLASLFRYFWVLLFVEFCQFFCFEFGKKKKNLTSVCTV